MKTEGKHILDMTCGGRSIWFDKAEKHTIFLDQREVEYEKAFGKDGSTRHIRVHPDVIGDFTNLPFENESFELVVFDPPHIINKEGTEFWMTKAYGCYPTKEDAQESVAKGIAEAMRVLKPYGVLVFKWSELSISTREILNKTNAKPLFGHRSGKLSNTHWVTFMKFPEGVE